MITWLIWYYTTAPCTLEAATLTGCNPAIIARYINVDIYGKVLTYSAILAGVGGVWNYDMFTKMRAVIAAERSRADEAEKQLAEYRLQVEEERRQEREAFFEALAEERQQAMEERQRRIDEERQRAAEERQRAAEERQQAAEDRALFAATLTEITAQLARLAERQNGNGQDGH